MKITVFGSGYVGLVAAACLAEVGNDVVCMDIDKNKMDQGSQGKVHLRFSNYQINTDLADEIFQEQTEEGKKD